MSTPMIVGLKSLLNHPGYSFGSREESDNLTAKATAGMDVAVGGNDMAKLKGFLSGCSGQVDEVADIGDLLLCSLWGHRTSLTSGASS